MQLNQDQFAIRVRGAEGRLQDVLSDWQSHDLPDRRRRAQRGGDAGLLTRLAITAFYSAVPARQKGSPDDPEDRRATYPEIYLFHVGGRHWESLLV